MPVGPHGAAPGPCYPLSPLLANIALHTLDEAWQGGGHRLGTVVRYADDLVILCATHERAEQAREVVAAVLDGLGLRLHPEKTRIADYKRLRDKAAGYARALPRSPLARLDPTVLLVLPNRARATSLRDAGVADSQPLTPIVWSASQPAAVLPLVLDAVSQRPFHANAVLSAFSAGEITHDSNIHIPQDR